MPRSRQPSTTTSVSFAKFWHPTLVSYGLKHQWVTEYLTRHGVSLTDVNIPFPHICGIFKFRLSNRSPGIVSTEAVTPSDLSVSEVTTNDHPVLEEVDLSEDSGSEGSNSDSGDDWDDDLDF